MLRAINVLPVRHRWNRVPGVTLRGHAARLRSPFAGEGANLAVDDGSELGQAIAAHPDDTAALTAYEQALSPRSEELAADSDRNQRLLFGDDTPHSFLALITGQDAGRPTALHSDEPSASSWVDRAQRR